jgi:predicted phosphohydrolase
MSLFVIADLHLSSDGSKSMEVFGPRWRDYMKKIEKNWRAVVTSEDTVIIPGDVSWGLKPEDAVDDLLFLESLPGQKLIGKGNHDFWWTTATKMNTFFADNNFSTIEILYNNAFVIDDMIIAGTRGWFIDEKQQNTVGEVDYDKIINREVGRLRLSLEAARRIQADEWTANGCEREIVPFLHFPPVFGDFRCREFMDVLAEYGVRRCYYGHIHSELPEGAPAVVDSIHYILCAADHLRFTPLPVFPTERFTFS